MGYRPVLFGVLALLLLLLLLPVSNASRYRRQAVASRHRLWVNAVIPYELSWDFTTKESRMIRKAMDEWEKFTCVRFRPANDSNFHKVVIHQTSKGCWSDVGAGMQTLNLGPSCIDHHTLLHELGHVLGLYHEHERRDRDHFVKVQWHNISPENYDYFQTEDNTETFGLPYCYRSVMHYSKTDFALPWAVSMVAVNPNFTDIMGRASHLSFRDAQLVNRLYGCEDCVRVEKCPQGAFLGPNCRCWCPSIEYTAVDCLTKRAIDPSRVIREHGKVIVDTLRSHTYYGSMEKADWFSAKRKCASIGGWLVNVDSYPIMDRLYTILGHLLKGKYVNGNDTLWISGNDLKTESHFYWGNGNSIDMSSLRRRFGEPDNGRGKNEDCLAVRPNPFVDDNYYYDSDCGVPLRYICELPHLGCYDRSPTCSYYSQTGQCEKFGSKCRKSCGICGKTRLIPAKVEDTSPPRTVPSTPCHSLSCSSKLTYDLLDKVPIGEDICVRCPECLCVRLQHGFGIYPDFARICCAVLQMAGGSTRGIHVITRRSGRHQYPGGRRNDVVSRWADFSKNAFTVKGYEPTIEKRNSCVRFTCRSSPMRSQLFKRLLIGSKYCFTCPPCQCNSSTNAVFGHTVYHRRSSACCAVAHHLGKSHGGFFTLKKVPGRSTYSGTIQHGVRSNRTTSVDDWAFRVYPRSSRMYI